MLQGLQDRLVITIEFHGARIHRGPTFRPKILPHIWPFEPNSAPFCDCCAPTVVGPCVLSHEVCACVSASRRRSRITSTASVWCPPESVSSYLQVTRC